MIRILGFLPIGWEDAEPPARQFVARFGDIREIRPLRGERAEVTLKNGTTWRLDGGSNDIGAAIHVEDPIHGDVDLPWKEIERIVLEPVRMRTGQAAARPDRAPARARRLYGEVATDAGTFTGFIQWDSQECLTTDRLDGDTDEGRLSLRWAGSGRSRSGRAGPGSRRTMAGRSICPARTT